MTVEQLIALLNNVKDKTKIVTTPDEMLVTMIDEYIDYVIIANESMTESIPEILH